MPDDLDRAVDAQIDAHRPDRVPPFEQIVARKRSRDRRRLATGGAALSAVAIAGAAVLAPSLAGSGDRLVPEYAASPAPAASAPAAGTWTGKFTVRYTARGPVDPGTAERVEACLALPGVRHADKKSVPPVHGVDVTGQPEAEAFAACVRALAGDRVTLTEHRLPALDTEADIGAFVESCAGGRTPTPVAGYVGMTVEQALAPALNSRILGRDGVCNPGSPVLDPTIVDVVIADGLVVWAGHLAVPDGLDPAEPPALAAPPSDPTGAEICKDTGSGSRCYSIDQAQAERLGAALTTARRVRLDTPECTPAGPTYRIAWQPRSRPLDPVVWKVPSADCQPMTAGGGKYDLDADGHNAVARAWTEADRAY